MNGDEDDLPDWFRKDEKKHNSMQVTVDRVSVDRASGGRNRHTFSCKEYQKFTGKLA